MEDVIFHRALPTISVAAEVTVIVTILAQTTAAKIPRADMAAKATEEITTQVVGIQAIITIHPEMVVAGLDMSPIVIHMTIVNRRTM